MSASYYRCRVCGRAVSVAESNRKVLRHGTYNGNVKLPCPGAGTLRYDVVDPDKLPVVN